MLDFLSSSFLGESVSKFVHETGFAQLFLQEGGYKYLIMIAVGCFFLYLAIKHKFEPMLLVPIGFGIIIGNIPMVTGHGIASMRKARCSTTSISASVTASTRR